MKTPNNAILKKLVTGISAKKVSAIFPINSLKSEIIYNNVPAEGHMLNDLLI